MNLNKKKALASRTLGVGKDRIVFLPSRLSEINEAITKQDIKDLVSSSAILIKEIKGKKKVVRRKHRRRAGSVRKKVKGGKQAYVKLTRKLRKHIMHLKGRKEITGELYYKIRQEIKASSFKDLAHLKERIKL